MVRHGAARLPPDARAALAGRATGAAGLGRPPRGPRRPLAGRHLHRGQLQHVPFDVERVPDGRGADSWRKSRSRSAGCTRRATPTAGATGRINYTVWSEVFSCPDCVGEIVFLAEALDKASRRTRSDVPLPALRSQAQEGQPPCGRSRRSPTPQRANPWKRIRLRPVLNRLHRGRCPLPEGTRRRGSGGPRPHRRSPAAVRGADQRLSHRRDVPRIAACAEGVHARAPLVPARAAHALAALWRRAEACESPRLRSALLFFIEQAIWGMSVLNRYGPSHFSQVNRQCLASTTSPPRLQKCARV